MIVPLIDGWIQLKRGDVPSLLEDEPVHLTLMQDSAPAHASASTRADLRERSIQIITWPPFSPDLNPIENCWNWMKNYQDKMWGDSYVSLNEERERIKECWEKAVTDDRLHELLATMPQRCRDVVDAESGPTKW